MVERDLFDAESTPTATEPGVAYLSEDGRALLEERICDIEGSLTDLQDALDDPERRADAVEGYQRAVGEAARLRSLLERAEAIEDIPDDPGTVMLGDTVAIRLDDGTEEHYVIAHAAEAAVDDHRISVDAPLAKALLNRRVGETIDVVVPAGSYRCEVLSATREVRRPAGVEGASD